MRFAERIAGFVAPNARRATYPWRRSARLGSLLIALALAVPAIAPAQAQITTSVFDRVLMLKSGSETGTGFTIDVDGRQYLVTAKHIVAALGTEGNVEIFKHQAWLPIAVKVFRCDDPVDIAVLIPPAQLTIRSALEPTSKKLRYGQDMYFAGFPYGLRSSAAPLPGGYPVAFIKKATMSGEIKEEGASMLVLDGYNNPGFSGGPVIYRDVDQSGFVYNVAGVVKGFRADLAQVYKREEVKPEQITQDDIAQDRIVHTREGRTLRLSETGDVVKLNSDLLLAYNISYALDLIRKNPIGPASSDAFQP